MDKNLSGFTSPGQRGPRSDCYEWVLSIPQISSITESSPSDFLVLSPGHSLEESYPSAEMHSVYSATPSWLGHAQITVDQFSYPIEDSFQFLLSYFATFTYVMNYFIYFPT